MASIPQWEWRTLNVCTYKNYVMTFSNMVRSGPHNYWHKKKCLPLPYQNPTNVFSVNSCNHVMFELLYPRVQKIASVRGVVQTKGTIIAGTIASDTSFSVAHILGWFELIARTPNAGACWLVCFCCNVVMHLCVWLFPVFVSSVLLDLTDIGVE